MVGLDSPDDAAIWKIDNERALAITTDFFTPVVDEPYDYGQIAAANALSDLYAMGAAPFLALNITAMPAKLPADIIAEIIRGGAEKVREAGAVVAGGHTIQDDEPKYGLVAVGWVKTDQMMTKAMAKPGDIICVAGNLGHAHLGFTALETSRKGFEEYKQAFLQPTARQDEGIWFGEQTAITSMMDLSDGLYVDLKRLCEASSVAGRINLEALTPSTRFKQACDAFNLDATTTQLTGGEDYGLMISVSPKAYETIAYEFKQAFNYELICIGNVLDGAGIQIMQNNKPIHLDLNLFSHFGETN